MPCRDPSAATERSLASLSYTHSSNGTETPTAISGEVRFSTAKPRTESTRALVAIQPPHFWRFPAAAPRHSTWHHVQQILVGI
jgi:hypothetical protein